MSERESERVSGSESSFFKLRNKSQPFGFLARPSLNSGPVQVLQMPAASVCRVHLQAFHNFILVFLPRCIVHTTAPWLLCLCNQVLNFNSHIYDAGKYVCPHKVVSIYLICVDARLMLFGLQATRLGRDAVRFWTIKPPLLGSRSMQCVM